MRLTLANLRRLWTACTGKRTAFPICDFFLLYYYYCIRHLLWSFRRGPFLLSFGSTSALKHQAVISTSCLRKSGGKVYIFFFKSSFLFSIFANSHSKAWKKNAKITEPSIKALLRVFKVIYRKRGAIERKDHCPLCCYNINISLRKAKVVVSVSAWAAKCPVRCQKNCFFF